MVVAQEPSQPKVDLEPEVEPQESKNDEDKEMSDEKCGNTNKSMSCIQTRAQKRKLAESQNTESEKAQSEKALSEK